MEKIAIIDLGSNSARLVLVDILEGGYFFVFDELKESVRLGQDMETDGFLRPARIEQTKKTLQMFRRFCDSNGVEKIFAFARTLGKKRLVTVASFSKYPTPLPKGFAAGKRLLLSSVPPEEPETLSPLEARIYEEDL